MQPKKKPSSLRRIAEVANLEPRRTASPSGAPTRARLDSVTADGRVLIQLRGELVPAVLATSATELELVDAIRARAEVLVAFLDDDPSQPVILAVLRDRLTVDASAPRSPVERVIDLEATSVLRLRAGESSIELAASGRVEIRGLEVVSIAEGTNHVLGGTVKLN